MVFLNSLFLLSKLSTLFFCSFCSIFYNLRFCCFLINFFHLIFYRIRHQLCGFACWFFIYFLNRRSNLQHGNIHNHRRLNFGGVLFFFYCLDFLFFGGFFNNFFPDYFVLNNDFLYNRSLLNIFGFGLNRSFFYRRGRRLDRNILHRVCLTYSWIILNTIVWIFLQIVYFLVIIIIFLNFGLVRIIFIW